MAKPDCSELAVLISDMAQNIAAGLKKPDIDSVLKVLAKEIPVNREDLVDALVLANARGPSKEVSEVARNIAKIKREARADKKLNKAIDDLVENLEEGTLPEPKPRSIADDPREIKKLKATIVGLQKRLRRSEPALRKQFETRIKSTQKAIDDVLSGRPRTRTEPILSEELKALKQEADDLAGKLTDTKAKKLALQDIDDLQRHIDFETLPSPKTAKRTTTDAQLATLQGLRSNLRTALKQSNPAIRRRLEKQLSLLQERIKAGDFAPKQRLPEPDLPPELEKLAFERDELRVLIKQHTREIKPKSIWGRVKDPFDAARTLITGHDFSAVLRQGGFIVKGNPIRGIKNLPDMWDAFRSKRLATKINSDIGKRPNANLYKKAKLALTEFGGDAAASLREEIYTNNLLSKFERTKIGKGILFTTFGSERAYVTFLNKLRADTFDAMVRSLTKNGQAATIEELRGIANYINIATGRGDLAGLEKASDTLNTVFFAPRYVASRFQLLTGSAIRKAPTRRVKNQIRKEYAKYLLGMSAVYGVGAAAGGVIEVDPRSSDFGKIRFGNTRVDPISGLSQATVFLARIAKSERKDLKTGDILKSDLGGTTMFFLRSKLSPAGSAIVNFLDEDLDRGELLQSIIDREVSLSTKVGVNLIGEDITAGRFMREMVFPLSFREIGEVMVEQEGIPKQTAFALLALLGDGLQTFRQKTSLEKAKERADRARKKLEKKLKKGL
jgi:hypothetical protein